MTSRPQITFACGLYDRMIPLFAKQVETRDFDLQFEPIDDPRSIFDRQAVEPEFDASELSTSEYLVRLAKGDRTFVAIPAFPSRVFRHGFIVVNSNRVKIPKDLEGKTIGIQLYTMTASVWIRGILRDECGIDLSTVQWVQGEIDRPGFHGAPAASRRQLPATIKENTSGKSLDQLLVEGGIDAIVGADLPPSLGKVPFVQRLFPDYKEKEKESFKDRGIFPIMHLVVIRRELCEKYPQLPLNLYKALNESKLMALEKMRASNPLRYMLPWLHEALDEIQNVFGADPWPYGVAQNQKTLEAFVSCLFKDGMIDRRPSLKEIFPYEC